MKLSESNIYFGFHPFSNSLCDRTEKFKAFFASLATLILTAGLCHLYCLYKYSDRIFSKYPPQKESHGKIQNYANKALNQAKNGEIEQLIKPLLPPNIIDRQSSENLYKETLAELPVSQIKGIINCIQRLLPDNRSSDDSIELIKVLKEIPVEDWEHLTDLVLKLRVIPTSRTNILKDLSKITSRDERAAIVPKVEPFLHQSKNGNQQAIILKIATDFPEMDLSSLFPLLQTLWENLPARSTYLEYFKAFETFKSQMDNPDLNALTLEEQRFVISIYSRFPHIYLPIFTAAEDKTRLIATIKAIEPLLKYTKSMNETRELFELVNQFDDKENALDTLTLFVHGSEKHTTFPILKNIIENFLKLDKSLFLPDFRHIFVYEIGRILVLKNNHYLFQGQIDDFFGRLQKFQDADQILSFLEKASSLIATIPWTSNDYSTMIAFFANLPSDLDRVNLFRPLIKSPVVRSYLELLGYTDKNSFFENLLGNTKLTERDISKVLRTITQTNHIHSANLIFLTKLLRKAPDQVDEILEYFQPMEIVLYDGSSPEDIHLFFTTRKKLEGNPEHLEKILSRIQKLFNGKYSSASVLALKIQFFDKFASASPEKINLLYPLIKSIMGKDCYITAKGELLTLSILFENDNVTTRISIIRLSTIVSKGWIDPTNLTILLAIFNRSPDEASKVIQERLDLLPSTKKNVLIKIINFALKDSPAKISLQDAVLFLDLLKEYTSDESFESFLSVIRPFTETRTGLKRTLFFNCFSLEPLEKIPLLSPLFDLLVQEGIPDHIEYSRAESYFRNFAEINFTKECVSEITKAVKDKKIELKTLFYLLTVIGRRNIPDKITPEFFNSLLSLCNNFGVRQISSIVEKTILPERLVEAIVSVAPLLPQQTVRLWEMLEPINYFPAGEYIKFLKGESGERDSDLLNGEATQPDLFYKSKTFLSYLLEKNPELQEKIFLDLDRRLHIPNQESVRNLANTISTAFLENRLNLGRFSVGLSATITDTINPMIGLKTSDLTNPYTTYEKLKAAEEMEIKLKIEKQKIGEAFFSLNPEFPKPPKAADQIKFNQLPKINKNTLEKYFEALEKRIEELDQSKQKETLDYIRSISTSNLSVLKSNFTDVESRQIPKLLAKDYKADDIVPLPLVHLYALLEYLSKLPNDLKIIRENGTKESLILSPREEALLKASECIQGCSSGHNEGLAVYYRDLPPECREKYKGIAIEENNSEKTKISLHTLAQSTLEDVFSGPGLYKILTGASSISQLSHQSIFLRNLLFGKATRTRNKVEFDIYSGWVHPKLRILLETDQNKTSAAKIEETLQTFYHYFAQSLVTGLSNHIKRQQEHEGSNLSKQEQVKRNKEAADFIRGLLEILPYDERFWTDYPGLNLTERGAAELWKKIGYFQ